MLKPSAWSQIGANSQVLDWVENGVPIILREDPGHFVIPNRPLSPSKEAFVNEEINRLWSQGVIEKCSYIPQCVSPIHVIPKRNKKNRLIIDLRRLNSHGDAPRFANEDVRTVTKLIRKGDFLATVDLKDGFLHVPINKEYRDLLGFAWKGSYYRFARLPFGLCFSPFYFAKLIRPVVVFLRSLDIRVVAFVDDFILMSEPHTFTDHCDQIINTLKDLGWSINLDKSDLRPKTRAVYLGHKITTCGTTGYPEIAVTQERIRKLKRAIRLALKDNVVTARRLASITGQCVAMAQVILPAKLLLRTCYRLLKSRSSWSANLTLTQEVRQELSWWIKYVSEWNVSPVVVRPVQAQLVTDASHIAWGATLGELRASGQWNLRLSRKSSNYREMMAILLALQTFQGILRTKSVQILTDNATALAYIMNKGGPVKELTDIAKAIWVLSVEQNIHLQVSHIKGVDNCEADGLSRIQDNYNWKLNPLLFRMIDKLFGPHTVDRFASGVNTQLTRFNTRFWEPFTEGVDALAQQNWASEMNFVNPPFKLLDRIIDVVEAQRADATIIAPWWPGQVWFRRLRRMAVAPPLLIPNNPNSFRFMGPTPEPLRNRRWKIHAWKISGKRD
jgi:hypothetical protein